MVSDGNANSGLGLVELQRIIDGKTKPPGSLGRLESLAAQIGLIQRSDRPKMDQCRLTIFAGDHGIVQSGVSAYPQDVTRQMVVNFLNGGAAENVFARALGVDVQVVDAGVIGVPIQHPDLLNFRVAAGTRNFLHASAMFVTQCRQALMHGREVGATRDYDAVCFGEMGIGNTSSAALIFHKLLKLPLFELTGRGTGLDDKGLRRKQAILQQASDRVVGNLDVENTLIEYGGFEIVMMAGAMLGAASSGVVVIVDGFIASAAATAAIMIESRARDAMVFAHRSAERWHAAVVESLGVEPLLDLGRQILVRNSPGRA